ncbi:MFS transporter, partial [Candidatus Bathyarchaeota archaeon]|nr:MFS transporter [Candidatus Bathyarchaeota archaeon]
MTMSHGAFSKRIGLDLRVAAATLVLVANAFIWYFIAFSIIREATLAPNFGNYEVLLVLGVNITGIAVSGLVAAKVTSKVKKKSQFLVFWMLLGIFFSALPLAFDITTLAGLLIVSAFYGVYFGVGMPATMAHFAASTSVENRAKLAGITFLLIGLGFFILGNIGSVNILTGVLVLATVRLLGVVLLIFLKFQDPPYQESKGVSYASIITNRPFLLYFISWLMFTMVNYLTYPIMLNQASSLGEESFVQSITTVEYILIAIFAVISGFLADIFGRKRLAILGFIMLGLGYAILGITKGSIEGLIFYTVVDGIAWGILFTIFLFTIWGDLAHRRPSDKFYILGVLPYLLSNFIRIGIGPFLAQIEMETIFTFASIFLFISVLPLIYAPETLPEKKMKDREMK